MHFEHKEAVYKAIDPFVERYVRFTEVELVVTQPGDTQVTLLLPEMANGPTAVRATWQLDEEWIVATAYSVDRSVDHTIDPRVDHRNATT